MTEKCFADSNVFVYANDRDAGMKQKAAQELLTKLGNSGALVVSTQVVNETYDVLVRKMRLANEDAWRIVEVMGGLEVVPLSFELSKGAVEIQTLTKINFWDALIVAAAVSAGCKTLYTEDLSHGRKYAGLKVVNPFA